MIVVVVFFFKVSAMFAKNLFRVFQTEKPTQFGSTAAVVSAFTEVSINSVYTHIVRWLSLKYRAFKLTKSSFILFNRCKRKCLLKNRAPFPEPQFQQPMTAIFRYFKSKGFTSILLQNCDECVGELSLVDFFFEKEKEAELIL